MMPDMFTSKKFLASALASVIGFVGLMYGMSITEILIVTGPLTGYTVSQGFADWGKEAEKIKKQG